MEKKRRRTYTDAQLREALASMAEGMSVYQAHKQFQIPETTLRNKRDGKYGQNKCGIAPVLTLSEEKQIVDWIHYLGQCGFPVTKDQLLEVVAKLVVNLKRSNPFKDGVPGRYWYLGFMGRHPTVSKRVAQNLPTSRNQVTEEGLRAWFERVRAYFESNIVLDVLDDPKRIFNCDETAFFLSPKEKEVLVRKGSKRVYNRIANDEKECLTVLVNVSADAEIAPPMVLFPYKRLPHNLKFTVPAWWGLGANESGWMNMETFFEYITNVFYPWLLQKNIKLPVALFLDGHTSHISLPLSTFCKEKGIILIALLPNATHILQPLDVAVFRPVKGTWRRIVHEFSVKNDYAKLKRTDFAREVQKCFDLSLKPETIKNGFKCCGIYPFNANNIDYSKLLVKQNKNTDADHSTCTNNQDLAKFKQQFESRLSPLTLNAFKDAENGWTGDQKYEKLFQYWQNITIENLNNQKNTNLELGDTTLVNNYLDPDNISEVVLNFDVRSDGMLIPNEYLEVDTITNVISSSVPHEIVTPMNVSIVTESITDIEVLNDVGRSSSDMNVNKFTTQKPLPSTSFQSVGTSDVSKVRPDTPQMDIQVDIFPQELKGVKENMRTSTPESIIKNFSPQLSVSDIENSDNEITLSISKSLITKKTNKLEKVYSHLDTNLFTNTPRKLEDMRSTSSCITTPMKDFPTPFKQITTPFKNALYFPKKEEPTKKKIIKKVTPTVATAEEFMEHQRRVVKEKEEKEKLKLKRKQDAIEKKNNQKVKEKKKMKKYNSMSSAIQSPAHCFDLSVLNDTPIKVCYSRNSRKEIEKGQRKFETPSAQKVSDSENDCFEIRGVDAVHKVKRRNIFDTDSDSDSCIF